MKNFISILLVCLIVFSGIQAARADNISLVDGTQLKGKITLVLDEIVDINVNGGSKTIIRDFANAQPMDIVEIGLIHRKKIIGQVIHIDESTLHMKTPTGDFRVNRALVRNISLKQERINSIGN